MDDNVIKFPGIEGEIELTDEEFGPKISTNEVLQAAIEREFDDVIIIGTWQGSSNFYFASTTGEMAQINWSLDKAKQILLQASLENMEF